MAHFIRGTSSDLTPVEHSNDIFHNYLAQMSLNGLFGKKGSGKPIIVDNKLKAAAGDTVRYHFIPQNTADGIQGQNATIQGNEQSLDEYSFDLSVDIEAQAFKKKGKMTDKRIIWQFRSEAKKQLENWWANRSETLLIESLTGVVVGATRTWINTTDLVNGDNRAIRADGANGTAAVTAANSDNTAVAAAMNSADVMNTRLIEEARLMALMDGTYKMRPVKLSDGQEYFIMLLHPKAARDLKRTNEWRNRSLEAVTGLQNDPIAKGMLGVWDRVILKECDRVLDFTVDSGSNTYARNLLLGADAAVLAWAQTIDYTEQWTDYQRELGMAADEIRGQTKVLYDEGDGTDEDAGVAQVFAAVN